MPSKEVNMPLISIVVCTYNGAAHIVEQLQSILEQSYRPIEIIISDDASSDSTVSLVAPFIEHYPNIKLHAFDTNVGYIKNFERGIALAKGDYIALSDQDDWWFPKKIELLYQNITHHDLAYCDSLFVNKNLESLKQQFSSIKNLLSSHNPLHFIIDNCISGHAMLFHKHLFNIATPFPEGIPHDWWLSYCASLSNGVIYVDKALVKYRMHGNNVIANATNKKSSVEKRQERQHRLNTFYNKAQSLNHQSKNILSKFATSYHSFSLINNINRVQLFFKHQDMILKILKKSKFKKNIFCFNMFFKLK